MTGGAIRRDGIQYFPGWLTEAGNEDLEGIKIFDELRREGKTAGWGWTTYHHMRAEPGLRLALREAHRRLNGHHYDIGETSHDNTVSGEIIGTYAKGVADRNQTLFQRVQQANDQVILGTNPANIRRQNETFLTESARLQDGLVLEMGLLNEQAVA